MLRLARLSVLALIAAFALAGCSKDAGVLASVGGRVVTVDDFLAAARSAQDQYPGPPDSAKAMLLDDLVRRQLMLRHAQDLGWFKDTLTATFRHDKEKELLTESMRKELAPRDIPVSDAEIAQLYAWRDSSTHIQVIYCYTQAAARAAADEVRRGGDFAQVADRFNPQRMIPPGGDLGEQAPGSLVQPLDDLLRTAPVGEVIGPLEVPGQGWFVARVLGRSPRPQTPIDGQRPMLAEMIRQRKQRAVLVRNHQRLRAQYDLQLVPGGSQLLYARMNAGPNAPADLPPAQLAQPLARWQTPEGPSAFTMGDAVQELRTGQGDRPDPSILPSIDEWILLEASNRIVLTEARRRMIDSEPGWQRQLNEAVNGYILEAYYNEEVVAKTTPSSDDTRLAWERYRSQFDRLDEVKLVAVTFPDSQSLVHFAEHAGHAGGLRAAVAMVPGAPPAEDVELKFPGAPIEWEPLRRTFMIMQPGQGMGPLHMRSGWRMLQLVSKVQVSPDFASLDEKSRLSVQQQGVEMARERRLNELVEQLRTSFPIEIHRDRLKRLPWPVPAGG